MVRASGYLQTIDDFKNIVLKTGENGVPVYLRDVARIQMGPEMWRGIAELNGQGEVAGGVVILRSGKNAREVITAVRDKLDTLKASLPEGVEIVTTYDRSQLIDRAIDNLSYKLLEEFIVVAVVCALFLWHVRSAPGGDYFSATWPVYRLYRHALPGAECQHYVAGRDCNSRRSDGGCRHRHDRKRA